MGRAGKRLSKDSNPGPCAPQLATPTRTPCPPAPTHSSSTTTSVIPITDSPHTSRRQPPHHCPLPGPSPPRSPAPACPQSRPLREAAPPCPPHPALPPSREAVGPLQRGQRLRDGAAAEVRPNGLDAQVHAGVERLQPQQRQCAGSDGHDGLRHHLQGGGGGGRGFGRGLGGGGRRLGVVGGRGGWETVGGLCARAQRKRPIRGKKGSTVELKDGRCLQSG